MQNSKTDWKKRELASLWPKEGRDFFTGRLTLGNLDTSKLNQDSIINVIMFRNKNQNENNSRPMFSLYVQGDDPNGQNKSSVKAANPEKSKVSSSFESEDSDSEDNQDIDALFS